MMIGFLIAATSTLLASPTAALRMGAIAGDLTASGVPESYVQTIFADPRIVIRPLPPVSTSTATSTPPAPPTPTPEPDWKAIQKEMLIKKSILKGKMFIAANKESFAKAEKKYGVSKESLTAVMRIETNLGGYTGESSVFNAFANGVVNGTESRYPAQATNLKALVRYCYQNNMDCFDIKGSYAGAFGLCQFLPHSVMTWGVDGNEDGKIDLFDPIDAIPSTANFLKDHGWGKTTASRKKALGRYYGSSSGYPDVTLAYGEALKKK